MFNKAKDLASMLKNAKALQSNMEEAKKQLASTVFTSKSDAVELSINGVYQIQSLVITEGTSASDAAAAVVAAYNDCLTQINRASEEQIKNLSKDFNIGDLIGTDDK